MTHIQAQIHKQHIFLPFIQNQYRILYFILFHYIISVYFLLFFCYYYIYITYYVCMFVNVFMFYMTSDIIFNNIYNYCIHLLYDPYLGIIYKHEMSSHHLHTRRKQYYLFILLSYIFYFITIYYYLFYLIFLLYYSGDWNFFVMFHMTIGTNS